ncbi:MAG TPA: transmembrane 220 family protein [Candidatus Synoicihabitans sp.]|nr:transmembrane 220 family protein [Candidatus Synoicihabitans sp.]
MRALHVFFAALFVFAAVVQYNDPSPALWMAIYLVAAVICLLAASKKPSARPLALVVGALTLVWSLTYLPAVLRHGQVLSMFDEWEMKNQEVLENREMFGLLIVTVWMAVVFIGGRRERR